MRQLILADMDGSPKRNGASARFTAHLTFGRARPALLQTIRNTIAPREPLRLRADTCLCFAKERMGVEPLMNIGSHRQEPVTPVPDPRELKKRRFGELIEAREDGGRDELGH